MKLINLTILRRKRLQIMLEHLFPEYGFINIKRNGLVNFKKKWYSFRIDQKNINITDLCIYHVPIRLDRLAAERNLGNGYIHFFTNMINAILRYKVYEGYADITDYLWTYYQKITRTEYIVNPEIGYKKLLVSNQRAIMIHPLSRLNLIPIREVIRLISIKTNSKAKLNYLFGDFSRYFLGIDISKLNKRLKIFDITLALPASKDV